MKVNIFILALVFLSLQATAQETNEYGITCKVIEEGTGAVLQDNVVLSALVSVVSTTNGQEVFRKNHDGQVAQFPIQFTTLAQHPVFSFLKGKKVGDSLCIEVPYNEQTKAMLHPQSDSTSIGYFYIKITDMETMAEREEKARLQAAKEIETQDAAIRKYLADNNLTDKAEKLPSGMYIIRTLSKGGTKPVNGQSVDVHYTGTLLNETEAFDSSISRGKPFQFPLGQGRVIKGWDIGIAQLGVGDKAILILPPQLGYGARGAGAKIPPSSILKFEVELVGIQ